MAVVIEDVISFDINAAMASQYSASVRVTNQAQQYDQDLIATVLTVTLNCVAYVANIGDDYQTFNGSKQWINGIIAGVDEAEGISAKNASLRVKSFFARLAKKAINTENFDEVDTTTAIETALQTYMGVPSALTNIITDGALICSPISGSNSIDELKRVAQAGGANLFVGEDGLLYSELWKDHNSSVDWTIPDEGIVSATIQRNDEIPATRIKVRGCFIWDMKKGDQPMTDAKTGSRSGGKGGGNARKGGQVKCIKLGLAAEEIAMKLGQLKGDAADIKNATFTLEDEAELTEITTVEDGTAEIKVTKPGTGYYPEGDYEAFVKVDGKFQPKDAVDNAEVKNVPKKDDAVNDLILKQLAKVLGAKPNAGGGPAGGGGSPNKGGNKAMSKNADEPVEVQLEITVDDPDLQAKYGIIDEQLENRYVCSKEKLARIAIRRFQEIKMKANTWSVQFAYLPSLSLSDVITFDTPETTEGGEKIVTGLLSSIRVSYDSSPKATMSGTVESFGVIGSTDYVLGNLILDPDMKGVGVASDWSWSVGGGGGRAQVADGFGFLDGSPALNGEATIQLAQPSMTPGESYTIVFDYVLEDGSEDLDFLITDGLGAIAIYSLPGSGTQSHTFTCREADTGFSWVSAPVAFQLQYRIKNVMLTSAVTA